MAPIVVKNKVIVGSSGGEMGVRGWIAANCPKDICDRPLRIDPPELKPWHRKLYERGWIAPHHRLHPEADPVDARGAVILEAPVLGRAGIGFQRDFQARGESKPCARRLQELARLHRHVAEAR